MNADAPTESAPLRAVGRVELLVGALFAVALTLAHWSVLRHAGALWRDEVSSVNVATLPSFGEMLRHHHWDSFPILWCVVLRGWIALGFGAGDADLRVLGFVIGLGIVAALWWNARRFALGAPLVALVVFAGSATALRFGDGVRGYGLGALLLVLVIGAIWNLVREPTPRRALVALVTALLAVQSSYANSPMLLAVCGAGAAVCIRRRAWKCLLQLAVVGAAALISMLPYLRVVALHDEWSMILRAPIDLAWIAARFTEAVDASGAFMIWVWIALAALTLATCVRAYVRVDATADDKDLALYAGVAFVLGAACFTAYIKALSVLTQSWYYLPILALASVAFEVGVHFAVRSSVLLRTVRLVALIVLAVAVSGKALESARLRSTTMDEIAREVTAKAARDDLILVQPWYAGIGFARYYRGSTPWMIVPDLDTRLAQPYGAFKERMTRAHPIQAELERIGAVLRDGRRVWLVGGMQALRPGETWTELGPAPDGPVGWSEPAYTAQWSREISRAVQADARLVRRVSLPDLGPVFAAEDLSLLVAEGRR